MQVMIRFFKEKKLLTLVMCLLLLLQVFGTLYVPYLVAELIDSGISSRDMGTVTGIGVKMLLVAVGTGLVGIFSSYYSAKLAAGFSYFTRRSVFQKVQELSVNDLNEFGVASLLTRTINDVENASESLVLFSQMILPAPLISIIAIYMTATVSKELVWIPLAGVLVFVISVAGLMAAGNKYSVVVQEKMDRIVRSLREFYSGIRVIRAFNSEGHEKKKTDGTFTNYAENMIRLNKLFAVLTPIVSALIGLSMAAILWFGGLSVGEGHIQIGSVTAVVEYVTMTLMYLITAAMVLITLPSSIASLYRINEVFLKEPEINDQLKKAEQLAKEKEAVVSFKNVSFTYPDAEDPVLNNISFEVKRGETVAIVGSTGSGKSTIAKLLLRFSDVSSGVVKVNGLDVRMQEQKRLREQISYVPQKAYLFSGTILENLKVGDHEATMERIKKYTAVAQARDFIQKLPDSYASFVAQSGSNYSGGQKQRLSIARALIKKADVYVFDDSFSALDYQTDSLIRQALKKELQAAATIIVAQRLSTVVDADQIILIDQGEIVGCGTHETLLQKNELYRDFAKSQQLLPE